MQIERLLLPLPFGAVLLGDAASLFAHKTVAGLDLRLLQGFWHYYLQGFTFLTTNPVFYSTRVWPSCVPWSEVEFAWKREGLRMRVWQISSFGIDSLEFVERPTPAPGPGEVLVRVRAISFNYRDLLMVKGLYNPKMKLPRIPCSDGAGEVVAVGEGVSSVEAGRPRGRHLYAELA